MNFTQRATTANEQSDEYEICTRRGHVASGCGITQGDIGWAVCKFCRTQYYFAEPELIENDNPLPFSVF